MKKHYRGSVFIVMLAGVLISWLLAGCAGGSANSVGRHEIVRSATLGEDWQMYQLRVTLRPDSVYDLALLELKGTDRVDGYYYTERGSGAALEIRAGATILHQYTVDSTPSSNRFGFTASQASGTAYVLKFSNPGKETTIIFVELIYPKTGSIRGPIDIK